MNFSKTAVATLAVAFSSLSLAQAEVALPSLDKDGKDKGYSFKTTFSFKSKEDLEYDAEQLSIIESAFMVSCNLSHEEDGFQIKSFGVDSVEHGHVAATHVLEPALRGNVETHYLAYFARFYGYGSSSCSLCGPDDDDSFMDEAAILGSASGKLRVWELNLCELLNKYAGFESVAKCKISIEKMNDDANEVAAAVALE